MRRFFLLLAFVSTAAFAQINESFNDGDFNANPLWTGNSTHFVVNTSGELQLKALEAGESYLSTPSEAILNASWECRLRMSFNPSSANYARIYLSSDEADPNLMQNGLYVEVGSTKDNVCLYSMENGAKTKLIEGLTGRVSLSSVNIKIRVSRTNDTWLLQSDIGTGYADEGTASYAPTTPSSYFALYCKYTSTRKDKFFFDDIVVSGEPYKDQNPPKVTNFTCINGTKMELTFNEPLDVNSITKDCFVLKNSQRQANDVIWNGVDQTISLHYDPILDDVHNEELLVNQLKDTDGNVITAVSFLFSYERIKVLGFKLLNKNTFEVNFSKAVPPEAFNSGKLTIDGIAQTLLAVNDLGHNMTFHMVTSKNMDEATNYNVILSHLFDAIGDEVPVVEQQLSYYFAKRFDVVINEIMVDPNPSMGLPETEYIELHNTTNQTIELSGWVLNVNGKSSILQDADIKPNSYLLLIPSTSSEEWAAYDQTLPLSNWSALTNTSCDIVLYNNKPEVMEAYRFKRDAINGEPFKADGGWSVERIDANNLSGEDDNYHWSMSLSGGTPGISNSVANENRDTNAPLITSFEMVDDTTLHLAFSETMRLFDDVKLEITPKPASYTKTLDTLFLNYLNLHFSQILTLNQIYSLNHINISDYAGHQLELSEPLLFGLADSLEAGDILINEVLFNPYPDGADFVELYNVSGKIIDISELYMASIKLGQVEKLYPTTTAKHLLMPHSYLVLTTDKTNIQEHYLCENPSAIIEVNTMPSLPDDEGIVCLTNIKGQIIEQFAYSDKMHFDLIKEEEGVSLERLSFSKGTNEISNWHSAASTAGYATPTYQNSQTAVKNEVPESNFSVSPEVFTPNGDGIDDLLHLYYNNTEVGGLVTIRIYDSSGKVIKHLANNESIGMAGDFVWDGLSDKSHALRPGIYIIYIQKLYPSGQVIQKKLSCVIGQGQAN